MKILYSHRTKSADGQYVHIRSLTEALKRRGHELIMAGPDDDQASGPKKLDAGAGAAARAFLPKPVYEIAELCYSAPAYFRLDAIARATDPDILYERYNLFYHSGVRLARARNLPFILEVNSPLAEERAKHGGLAFPGLARASEGSIWRAADRVLPVTRALARHLEAAGVSPERIVVIQNGVENDFLAAQDGSEVRAKYGLGGKIVLGFTGFVRDWHGIDRIIAYLGERRRDDLHFLVVGDGDVRAQLLKDAEALGIAKQVTFTGTVQREDVARHVAAFDIALQPAVTAYASPLKLFEYMALGKAIIAPKSPNIEEVLREGEDCLLTPPGDAGALAAALDRLIGDSTIRGILGAQARHSLIRQGLTWAENARRVEQIAAELLSAREKAARRRDR